MFLVLVACGPTPASSPAEVSSSDNTPALDCSGFMMVSSSRGQGPEEILRCTTFTQRAYWLGKRLSVRNAPDLFFVSSWTEPDEQPITLSTRLVPVYRSEPTGPTGLYLIEWARPAWSTRIGQFTGYAASTVPGGGPVNWWQHPCVEKEVYRAANGAEVHLFKAHLVSLIYIYPKTAQEVARCLREPVGAVGAHVYFERTVIEFSLQHNVSPAGPPSEPRPKPILPGDPPDPVPTPTTYPTLVRHSENPNNNENTARFIAGALQPYDGK